MKGIEFARRADATIVDGYVAATCSLDGRAASSIVAFEGFGSWVVRAELSPAASLEWDDSHGDEGLYVVTGSIRFGARVCPSGGAVIVEAGAPAVVASDDGATLVHVGAHDPVPPAAGAGVHVIGPGGVYAAVEPSRDTRMFADSTCETCRITLFVTAREAAYVSAPHSHSADEILYLLRGEVSFGSHRLGPGDAVAIEGGHRYGFRSGPGGFAFLNHRRDASEQTTLGDAPRLEGGRARGLSFVNDVR